MTHGRERQEPEDGSLSLRVAQLEDAVAVLQAAVAHCKGLAEAATAAMSAGAFQHQGASAMPTSSTSLPVSPMAPRRADEAQAPEAALAPAAIPRKPTPPWQPLRLPPNTGQGLGLEPLPAPAQQQQPPPPMSPPPPPPPHLVPPRLQEQVVGIVEQIDAEVASQQIERQIIFESISRRIRRAWPHAEVACYGSMRAGLCTPTSDMDLVVLNAPAMPASNLISMLHLHFNNEPSVVTATPLPHAQLPLLKLQVRPSGRGSRPETDHVTNDRAAPRATA